MAHFISSEYNRGKKNALKLAVWKNALYLYATVDAVNHYACEGLDQMEKIFPALNQSTGEVGGCSQCLSSLVV